MLSFAMICAALYAALCLAVYVFQGKLVFFPGPPPRRTPAALGLAFEDVALDTQDGERLGAWLISPQGTPQTAVLVCHGNAGSIEDRLYLAEAMARMGLAVLLFDYRGYGASSGTPTEAGLYEDARAAYAYLTGPRGFAPEHVIVYGESLGGAVAIEIAARENVAALIVEDTFASLPAVGARHYPWLPVHWLSRYRFDSLAKLPKIAVPKLIIHSPDDEIVPFANGRALFEAAREPKQFLATSGGHNGGGFALDASGVARVAAFIHSVR